MPRPLPTELIRHIIKLVLPVVSYSTYRERYKLLLAFSLVNSMWSELAREELYKEVFVETGEELSGVLQVKQSHPGRRAYLGTVSPPLWGHVQLKGFTTTLGDVKHLSMSYMRFDANDWPAFKGLETLHLRNVHFRLYDNSPIFPKVPNGCLFRSLTTLSLLTVYLYDGFPTWTTWFTPTNLPQLYRLTIGTMRTSRSNGADNDFVEALELLAPQIQKLTVAEGYYSGIISAAFPWSAFTTIQRLALYSQAGDPLTLINAALAELPAASLTHLLVGYGHSVPNKQSRPLSMWETKLLPTLAQALEARSGIGSLRALEVLVLHYGSEAAKRGTLETSSQLEAVMKARGGVLERRVAWGQLKEQPPSETYLEPW